MMRDIKFRAWDGEDMIYFDLALVNDESPLWFSNTVEEGDVMQYTGLKDKNEKEVWEGDIVKHEGKVMVVPFAPGHVLISKEGAENLDVFVVGNIFENPNLLEK